MATSSSILAWRIHEQRSLVGYSPWDHKESDMTARLRHTQKQLALKNTHTDVSYQTDCLPSWAAPTVSGMLP